MWRLLIVFNVIILFTGIKSVYAIKIQPVPYPWSLVPIIECMDVDVKSDTGSLPGDPSKYRFSVNFGDLKAITSLQQGSGDKYTIRICNIVLKPGVNTIKLFCEINGVIETDCFTIEFLFPRFKIESVKDSEGKTISKQSDVYFVNYQNYKALNVSFSTSLSQYDLVKTYRKDYIFTAIIWKLNDGSWNTADTLRHNFNVTNLLEGINRLYVKCPVTKDDISLFHTDTISFFYSYFELKEPDFFQGNQTWKADKWIKLEGHPSGGWFTVDGEGKTNYFNPGNLALGNHNLAYTVPYGGTEFTTNQTIQVLSNYFQITGPKVVCLNQLSLYQVINDPSGFVYSWMVVNDDGIPLGTIILSPDTRTATIRWHKFNVFPRDEFSGKVIVTATHGASKATFTNSLLVHVKGNPPRQGHDSLAYWAPDPGVLFFGDHEKKLVICSVKSIKPDYIYKYFWALDGENPVETSFHYNYFENPGKKYSVDVVTPEGCKTTMELLSTSPGYSNKQIPIAFKNPSQGNVTDLGFTLYPNPADHLIKVIFQKPAENSVLRIFNTTSHLLYETKIEEGIYIKEVQTGQFPAGTYLLQISGPSGSSSAQFIKVN